MSADVVYHCYASDGECLYVGWTCNVEGRMAQHKHAPWARHVAYMTETPCGTPEEAQALEASEILSLRPRWNIHGRGPREGWDLADYVEVIIARHSRRQETWKSNRVEGRIRALKIEMSRRFPDVAQQILADLTRYTGRSAA